MNAFADGDDVDDLHIAQIRFGGDVGLKPGSEGFAQKITEDGKRQGERNQQDSPTGGFDPTKRSPGKSRREKRGSDEICPAARMDGESAFARAESIHCFG